MPDALDNLLTGLKRHQEAFSAARVRVEEIPDAECPGRTFYLVAGPAEGSVQAFIDRKMWEAEDHAHGGYAKFENPFRVEGGWASRGAVYLAPAQSDEVAA